MGEKLGRRFLSSRRRDWSGKPDPKRKREESSHTSQPTREDGRVERSESFAHMVHTKKHMCDAILPHHYFSMRACSSIG